MVYDLIIPEDAEKERLDIFLTHKFPAFSRSQIQNLIANQHITINEKPTKSSHLIRPNEKIRVVIPPPQKSGIKPEKIPLEIFYEDEHLLVLNKPAEMVVHPAFANYSGTLVNALLGHCKNLSGIGGVERPGIVHRLDKNTSGLMVVAKNDESHRSLAEQFATRTVEREYRAIVWGHPQPEKDRIETYLKRSSKNRTLICISKAEEGKLAITNYEVLEKFHLYSYLKIQLETGRTHQIRVHLQSRGHPVLGDPTYGGRNRPLTSLNQSDRQNAVLLLRIIPYQALHALTLGFVHPVKKEFMYFQSDIPPIMQQLLSKIRSDTV